MDQYILTKQWFALWMNGRFLKSIVPVGCSDDFGTKKLFILKRTRVTYIGRQIFAVLPEG